MSRRLRIVLLTTSFAACIAVLLYSLWGLLGAAALPLPLVALSAALIAIGIDLGESLRAIRPHSKLWLVPNVASVVAGILLSLPYPPELAVPLCMVSTAIATGRLHKRLSQFLEIEPKASP